MNSKSSNKKLEAQQKRLALAEYRLRAATTNLLVSTTKYRVAKRLLEFENNKMDDLVKPKQIILSDIKVPIIIGGKEMPATDDDGFPYRPITITLAEE